jgi:hypothetical protein
MQTIRKLAKSDEPALAAILGCDPRNNLFLLGNLLTLGMDYPELEYWGACEGERLAGALMRFRNNWAVYDAGGADMTALARILEEHPAGARHITGEYEVASRLWSCVRNYEAYEDHRSYFAVMDALVDLPGVGPARRATEADIPGLVALYSESGAMARDEAGTRRVLQHGRIFVATDAGKLVSGALTNAETPDMAMIGGVFTPPDRRKRGYATACVAALCRDLLNHGIQPCLFYDNPEAGAIYLRLGFRNTGTWRLLRLRAKQPADGAD